MDSDVIAQSGVMNRERLQSWSMLTIERAVLMRVCRCVQYVCAVLQLMM